MKKIFKFPDEMNSCLEFLQTTFDNFKLKKIEKNLALLMAEESLSSLARHCSGDDITITVSKSLGSIKIDLTTEGTKFDPFEDLTDANALLMKSFAQDLKYTHTRTKNRITITAYRSRHILIYRLVAAIVLGLLVSFLIRTLCSDDMRNYLSDNVFAVMKDIYMNALNLLIAPLIFFSIASSIAGFKNLSEIGRIAAKIMGIYLMTTVICISIAFAMTYLLQPYASASMVASAEDMSAYTTTQIDTSVKGFLMGIVPSNLFEPFVKSDTIGIMFIAFLLGIATIVSGEKARPFTSFLDAGNAIFLKITDVTVQLMPIMIFSYICVTLIPAQASSQLKSGLSSMLKAAVAFIITVLLMIIVYNLLLLIMGGLNPIKLIKKYAPHALRVIIMGSSSAAIPINIQVCKELGVSSSVYSLSIPLGATINMDGVSMYLAVFGLTFAKIYGIDVTLPVLLSIAFTIIMLSAGAPTIYGVSLICLSVLLKSLGVPVDAAMGMAVGMEVFAGMFRTINNSIGDMVGTLIVANKEGLLDLEQYNK
ncbi:MAG: dicarboxylate/amino acid:cation symporter [Lachnospiraceae bacterium]|nr:dicarboxylate/amino acid:cation symporter [Lachnospiraceae bacterium]